VIDLNFYPTKEAKNSNLKHRPVGLGIMGFQNALYKMNVHFDSDECVAVADKSMELVSYHAILSSVKLAEERGSYQSYRGSKWDRGILPIDTLALLEQERGMQINVKRETTMDWNAVREAIKTHGMRNSNCMAIAPTATISNIAGTTPTIEPIYKNIYVKANQAGDFTVVNPYLVEDLKKHDLWDSEMLGKLKYHDGRIAEIAEIPQDLKRKYKETFEIDPRCLVRAAAFRGKWIDQSQSFNVFYAGHSGKDINDIYMYAWEMGLKTTYYLRTLAVSQVEKSTVSTETFGDTHKRQQQGDDNIPIPTPQAVGEAPDRAMVAAVSVAAATTIASSAEVEQPQPSMQQPRESTFPQAVEDGSVVLSEKTESIKLCRIDDPDCEACQ
jgi:ribonucleoside-diphosphate reductase alpha chain